MAKQRELYPLTAIIFFPIIKKWLYSDHDIFFRELVSNGCDAITKLKKLLLWVNLKKAMMRSIR